MPAVPETRNSLVLRLRDAEDVDAWDEFLAVYEPLVYHLARKKGLQHADAEEIVQEVMLTVSRAVGAWVVDPKRGRFRAWLFAIARNLMINWLTRRKPGAIGSGDTAVMKLLKEHCDPSCEETAEFDLEYRRQVFRWVAERVRTQVKERTWEAFWLSSVEDQPIEQVAESLGITVGAVYVARSRVAGRLRSEASRFENVAAEGPCGSDS